MYINLTIVSEPNNSLNLGECVEIYLTDQTYEKKICIRAV